jgi:hypothetical protein
MSYRTPPQPTSERAAATERLILSGATDTARWAQFGNLASEWDGRAALAGRQIAPGSRVLDIGAGAMTLEYFLPENCSYFPADVVSRRPGCQIVDLNAGQFPAGTFDCVTFLGVLEYVHDIGRALRLAAVAAPGLVVTYCTMTDANAQQRRRGMGWVNDYTDEEFQQRLTDAGWRVASTLEVKRGMGNLQFMYVCHRLQEP